MRRFFRNTGLSLVLFAVFVLTWGGQFVAGEHAYNEDRQEHGRAPVGAVEYFKSGHFWQATAENWESEFLQMGMFIVLTCCLYQKGSPESKDPDAGENAVDNDPRLARDNPRAPWPVRRGGPVVLWLYAHSLSLCFFGIFFLSFFLHAEHGARAHNEEQQEHGGAAVTTFQYLGTSRFWFESMQNWQSEFLSLGAMVYLSVYLRQRGSAESKPVATPHDESGEDEPVIKPASAYAGGVPVGARVRSGTA
jgi:hypothetical protein